MPRRVATGTPIPKSLEWLNLKTVNDESGNWTRVCWSQSGHHTTRPVRWFSRVKFIKKKKKDDERIGDREITVVNYFALWTYQNSHQFSFHFLLLLLMFKAWWTGCVAYIITHYSTTDGPHISDYAATCSLETVFLFAFFFLFVCVFSLDFISNIHPTQINNFYTISNN